MINPIGFAYENYDALGRWRDTDRGLPVNARDSYEFASGRKEYDGATQLGAVIAADGMAHRCYAQHWLEFLYGRRSAPTDAALVNRVGALSLSERASVQKLLEVLVKSDAFTARGVGR
jgi:hypothetical protein